MLLYTIYLLSTLVNGNLEKHSLHFCIPGNENPEKRLVFR